MILTQPVAEFGFGPLVDDDRNRSVHQWQAHLAAGLGHRRHLLEVGDHLVHARLEPLDLAVGFGLILGAGVGGFVSRRGQCLFHDASGLAVAGHRGVTQHRFGSRRRDHDVGGLAGLGGFDRIAQVVELALHRGLVEFIVGHCGLQVAVPVDQPVALEDEPVAEHLEERVAHGPCADRVHREALAIPVAATPHGLLLLDDPRLVLVLPSPDPFDERIAADVVAGLPLEVAEPRFDHRLGGDAGVVGTRHPEGVGAVHAMPAREQVLHHVVHRVAHVQRPRDVGQRHHDDVAVVAVVGVRGEGLAVEPAPGHGGLDGLGIVLFCRFAHLAQPRFGGRAG